MRKALCVGIDYYTTAPALHGCVNDAVPVKNVLERNEDGSLNFETKLLSTGNNTKQLMRNDLKDAIIELFNGEAEIAVFYFSGHGAFDSMGGYLCTSEIDRIDEGLPLEYLMQLAEQSKARNKVIFLDSCHSGLTGKLVKAPAYSLLAEGITILAACEENGYALERDGHGLFTSLFVEALTGGAMNLLGEVSPGSIYAYIDQSLGAWDQRPVFKANIKSFVSLRKNTPPISPNDLRRITDIFLGPDALYNLDPTYEPDKHEADTREKNKKHEEIFALLQKYVKVNLVVPVGEKHMYYAAIHRKACRLTAQGRHYWKLVNEKKI